MEKITVRLCGTPEVKKGRKAVTFPYRKVDGFFYYLCVKKSVSRDEVIGLLWCDEDELSGKKKLRDVVYQLKRLLGKEIVETTGNSVISLNPRASVFVDLDAVKTGEQQAEGLFLDHFYIKNCYEYEEWIESVRTDLQRGLTKDVREKLNAAAREHDEAAMQEYGNLLLRNDPYDENLYYDLMNLYAESGNYTMAIRIYHDLVKLLKKDLGLEPSDKVKELFRRIFNIKENAPDELGKQEMNFFGRKKELFEVSGLLDQPADDRLNCLAVEGMEGVGKSTFLESAVRLAEGKKMLPLSAVCYRQSAEFFLSPWKDIFYSIRSLAERGMTGESAQAQEIQRLDTLFADGTMGGAENGRAVYQMIEHAMTNLMTAIASENRILLTFDDIHWMDQLSMQLLVKLVRMTEPDHLKMICSVDPGAQSDAMLYLEPLIRDDRIKFMTLAAFTEQETEDILHRMLPELDAKPEKRKEIYGMTGGNALFLKEVVNGYRESGGQLKISGKIDFMMRARLSELTPAQREILYCMSVFPEKINIEQMEHLLGNMDRLTILKELEVLRERQMVQEALVGWYVYYRFTHRMFGEFVYAQQSVGKRQVYHRMLAEYYEQKEGENFAAFPLIAWHYMRCNEEVKAYRYQIRYLRDYYTIINESYPIVHSEISDFGDDLGVMSEAEKMLDLAKNVIRLAGEKGEVGQMKMEMYYILGRHDIATGEYETGIENIGKSIRLAEKLDAHKNLLSCYKQMVFHGIQVGDLKEIKEYVQKGKRAIRQEETDEIATFLRLEGCELIQEKRYDEAAETLQESIRLFREMEPEGETRYRASIAACLNYLGDIARLQGDFEEAMARYQEAVETDRGKVMENAVAQVYNNIGLVKYEQERYAESYIYFDKAREALEKNGYFWGLERAEACLALVCAKSGKTDEAHIHYEKGLRIAEKIGNPDTAKLLSEVAVLLKKGRK